MIETIPINSFRSYIENFCGIVSSIVAMERIFLRGEIVETSPPGINNIEGLIIE